MADMITTPATAGLTPVQWDSDFFREYIRENRFTRYMGTQPGAMIQLKDDLTRKPGDTVVFAAMRKLIGAGVTGNTILEGNEEIMDFRSMKLIVNPIRHGVAVTDWDEQKSVVDLRNAARPALMDWAKEKLRNDLITSMLSVQSGAYAAVPFGSATAAQRDAWLVQNTDRVLFGNSRTNGSSGSSATALGTVTTGTGKLTAAALSLAKRMAKLASPAIRPIQVKGDQEWFVMFANTLSFRDLRNDPDIKAAQQYAAERGKDNILFTGDDIIYDGVIVREIPEFPIYTGIGSGGTDVGPNVLMGAQALGVAYAQRTKSATNTRDYDFRHGVAVQEIRGIGKLVFGRNSSTDTTNLVDQGMVTIFSNATADA